MKTPTFIAAVSAAFAVASVKAATYSEDFTGFPDGTTDVGAGTILVGNANVTPQVIGEQLRLTENTNNNNAAFHIPALTDSSKGFTVTFDLTISDPAGDNPPADGIAFSYGAIPFGGNSPLPEEGWPGENALSFEIDTWNAASDWGPAIGVNRPANVGAVGNSLHSSSVAYTAGQIFADGETRTASVTISYDRGLGASFATSGFITDADFTNVPTKGFAPDDTFTFAIAGRTGGANEEVLIDNLVIDTGVVDTDGDGMSDAYEIARGLDPNDDGSTNAAQEGADGDLDGDGLSNIEEHDRGTLPNNDNTDGDNLLDGLEDAAGRDPCVFDDPPLVVKYEQDFDGFADGTTDLEDSSTIASNSGDAGNPPGPASVQMGELLVTQDDINNQRASFRVPALGLTDQGWVAAFDYTLTDAAGGNPPADGFSFSYGAIPDFDPALGTGIAGPTGHGAAEEGWGGLEHVSFEVDVWQPLNPAQDAGVNIASNTGANAAQNHAFTPGDVMVDGETRSGRVVMAWHPTDGASFYTTGLLTNADFTEVPVPDFVGSDQYRFAISARTGGANEGLTIDNIIVCASDGDLDNDGLGDAWELLHGLSIDPDTGGLGDDGATGNPDGDGLDNAAEFAVLSDPNSNDTDGDMLLDHEEVAGAGDRPATDPTLADTDGDTLDDFAENNSGTFVDATETGTDPTDADTDDDMYPDGREVLRSSDPLVDTDFPASVEGGVYSMDFEAYPVGFPQVGDGSIFGSSNGTAGFIIDRLDPTNRALKITDLDTGGTRASFRIPAIPGSEEGWTATFDVAMVDRAGGNVPADGFSFNYGAIPELVADDGSPGGHGAAEAGHGSGNEIAFVVDTWQNGNAANPGGVAIRESGTDLVRTDGQTLNNNGSLVATMTIVYTPTTVSFTTTGLNDTNASFVEIPHTLLPDETFSWVISARTGGAFQDLIVDNLVINVPSADDSAIEITDIQFAVDPGDGLADVTITWTSKPDRSYILYASETAEQPFNADVADGIPSAGDTTSFTVEDIDTSLIPTWLFRVAEEE